MLDYTMGYTFASTYNSQHTVSKYISNHARNLINGMISIHKYAFEAGLSGLWKQRQGDKATDINAYMAPSYSVWNLKLGYDVVKNVKIGVEADNLFDAHYQDILGAVMPGRWIMGTVSWNLSE
jgi:iron complex outermembrane receptor protein